MIKTKLVVPPSMFGAIDRGHLTQRLSLAKNRRLILVSGQAGSGKTSLISQWIHKDKIHAFWYSQDKTDDDEDVFFRYALTLLSRMDNSLADRLNSYLCGGKRLTGEKVLVPLINDFPDFSESKYLVLDDYHHITSDKIHRVIHSLLR